MKTITNITAPTLDELIYRAKYDTAGNDDIHGHIHNNTDANYFQFIQNMPTLLNAEVEINNYRPVSFNELLKNNIKFKEIGASI